MDTSSFVPPKLTKAEFDQLITCEICGYMAVSPDSNYCYNCLGFIFDPTIYEEDERQDWLRNEQLMWFGAYDGTDSFSFYEPKIEQYGFKKNNKWKSSVLEEEVRKEMKEYEKK